MTFAEFKKKWSRYLGKETSAYQSHFRFVQAVGEVETGFHQQEQQSRQGEEAEILPRKSK